MRQIDFSDGYETSAAPDQGVITTGGFGAYSSDANFVTALTAAGGTLTQGHAYYNTVLQRIRFYNGSNWITSLSQVDDAFFLSDYANDAAYIAALTALSLSIRAGSAYFNTTDNMVHYYDGASWHSVVGHDVQATLTNKDIDLGTATSSKRITVSKATLAVLTALPRKAGTIYYATDGAAIYYDDGVSLISAFSAPVSSVNGYAGVVVLDTDDIAEGATNLYFTVARVHNYNMFKLSCEYVETTTNIPLAGAVPVTIDGSVVASGTRVLLTAQSSAVDNGLYYYVDDTVNYTLVRVSDANGTDMLKNGTFVYVNSGTLYAQSLWILTTANPITIGATSLTFVNYSTAFIQDVITNGVTTRAPSQNAVFDALALKENTANKGAASGYCPLDGSSLVPLANLPSTITGAVDYIGAWNANTNTPDLPASTPNKGDYYVVSVAGTTSLGGITDWQIGDWAIYNGTVWEKVDNSESVTSVNGFTGTVVIDTDDIAEGATNLYFTDTRAKTAVVDDSITNGITDKAPSQNAVFDALALKLDKTEQQFKLYAQAAATSNTALSAAVPLSIDGVTIANGNRVLLTNQTSAVDNGIYDYLDDGVNYTLTRSSDADGTSDIQPGLHIYIAQGTANGGVDWYCSNTAPITIGVTGIGFFRISSQVVSQVITNGVTKFAPSEDAVFDALALKKNDFSVLPETQGGTNQSTYATGDLLYASAANTLSKLGIGTNGQRLKTVAAGIPAWEHMFEASLEHFTFDDFLGSTTGLGTSGLWQSWSGGAGAAQQYLTADIDNSHPGVINCTTGTTSTGRCGQGMSASATSMANGYILGTNDFEVEALIKITTLSTVGEEFVITLGSIRHSTADAQANAVMFQYDRLNSTNWRCITVAASSQTTTDSGVAVVAGSWIKLKILANTTSARFYINGSLVATNSTNLPTVNIVPGFKIQKSAGTTSRDFSIDYFKTYKRFNTAR